MIRSGQMTFGLVVSAWLLTGFSSASAQMAPPPDPSTNTPPTAAMMMNPYLNPYMNPLLNPAAPQQKLSTGNSLLFLYSAQAANGGIGSGRLSNPGKSTANTRKKPALMPNSASMPGGGASHYFNPGPGSSGGVGRYYNQRGRFFNSNGH